MMNYTVAISVLLSLNDSEKQFGDDTVLDAVEKILSMETINATPKDALLNALRWLWAKCVEEEMTVVEYNYTKPKEEA